MTVDWSKLDHAYGPATDTPEHLSALEFGDAAERLAALGHLDTAVLHQGFPATATAPALRAVTTLLAEGRAHPDTVEALLEFLGHAAYSLVNLAGNSYFAAELPGIADAITQAYPVVLPLLETSPPQRAMFRAYHLTTMAQTPRLADEREMLAVLVLEWAERDTGPQADWIQCLARLGVDLRYRIDDPDPAVRLSAALGHEDDPRCQELILTALAEPPPPGVQKYDVVAAAIRIAADFDAIADAACRLAERDRNWPGADLGWGALVKFAFPQPYGKRRPLSSAQRALLRALVANDNLWNPKDGNCAVVFKSAGLPHSRGACRRLSDPE